MALVLIKLDPRYIGRFDEVSYYEDMYEIYKWHFNTVTLLVEITTEEQSYINGMNVPGPYSRAATVEVHSACLPESTTMRRWFHNGAGSTTYQDTPNAGACGYVAPTPAIEGSFVRTQCFGLDLYNIVADGIGGERKGALAKANSTECGYVPPACDLVPVAPYVQGYTVQLGAATSFPPVEYSLNGSPYTEESEYSLAPGMYEVGYKDANPRGCLKTNSFNIVAVVSGVQYSRNPHWQKIEAAAGSLITMELFAESEHYKSDFKFIVQQQKVATLDGAAYFRLDNVLDRLVSVEPPSGSATVIVKKGIINYYVRYKLEAGDWIVLPQNTVLLGGMPLESVWFSPFGHFLTSQAREKRVKAAHPEYLYWLCSGGTTSLKIRRGSWIEGAAAPVYTLETLTGLKSHQLVALPAFSVLVPNLRMADVTILGPGDVPLSETMTYRMDPHPDPDERCFLFHNSWGGFDTLRCTGSREEILDSKEEIGELDLRPGYQPQQGQRFVFSRTASRKIKQSTGPNAAWQQEYLQDFVLSMARYELRGNQLFPIILSKKSLENSTRDVRQGYVFEYDYAFDTVGYAKFN